jgi:glycosyltransferase involved in cell wall biosynthesis
MACGLPVITTDVGGNKEVVCREELGTIVPYGNGDLLQGAIKSALGREWDREQILAYAADNSWDSRVAILEQEFLGLTAR